MKIECFSKVFDIYINKVERLQTLVKGYFFS